MKVFEWEEIKIEGEVRGERVEIRAGGGCVGGEFQTFQTTTKLIIIVVVDLVERS